jgi:hypothetical protein
MSCCNVSDLARSSRRPQIAVRQVPKTVGDGGNHDGLYSALLAACHHHRKSRSQFATHIKERPRDKDVHTTFCYHFDGAVLTTRYNDARGARPVRTGEFDAQIAFDGAGRRLGSVYRFRTGPELRSELPGLHDGLRRDLGRQHAIPRLHFHFDRAMPGDSIRACGNVRRQSVLRARLSAGARLSAPTASPRLLARSRHSRPRSSGKSVASERVFRSALSRRTATSSLRQNANFASGFNMNARCKIPAQK